MHYILGQRVDVVDYEEATSRIVGWARAGESRYVCLSNVHMVMEGHDDPSFRDAVNGADLIAADGKPLVWAMHLAGVRKAQQVRGPALMPRLLREAAREQLPVGLLGSTDAVLARLTTTIQSEYPELRIPFVYSPPFRELTAEEDDALAGRIRESGARILFVALGCPKQERWMAAHRERLACVQVGVGAAFDFIARTQREAPVLAQRLGFEWAFRLSQEPRRLWRRYLRHNPRFVLLASKELLDR